MKIVKVQTIIIIVMHHKILMDNEMQICYTVGIVKM